ncbi:MAG TPA: SCO family protein [Actinobacteria bacterium]|nr:SCO family protein [Actinomycetota bacterium]
MSRLPTLAAVAGLLLAAAACGGAPRVDFETTASEPPYETVDEWAGYRRLPPPEVGDVAFVDHAVDPPVEYHPVASDDGLLLVYFGYLSCPDVCPTTLADVGKALSLLPAEEAARIEVAMVTVDPERDEGAEIARYLDVFVDRYHALVAPDDAALAEAAEAFGVRYEIEPHEPGDTDYEVGHTATLFVVDDEGRIVWEFGFGTAREDLADTLAGILAARYP